MNRNKRSFTRIMQLNEMILHLHVYLNGIDVPVVRKMGKLNVVPDILRNEMARCILYLCQHHITDINEDNKVFKNILRYFQGKVKVAIKHTEQSK